MATFYSGTTLKPGTAKSGKIFQYKSSYFHLLCLKNCLATTVIPVFLCYQTVVTKQEQASFSLIIYHLHFSVILARRTRLPKAKQARREPADGKAVSPELASDVEEEEKRKPAQRREFPLY